MKSGRFSDYNSGDLIEQLIRSFCCLPGIGPKSAQRMAFFLLERDRTGALRLATAITEAIEKVRYCESCHTLSEKPLCSICADLSRDKSLLCVIESPTDAIAIEQTSCFSGLYFVLLGRLSPLDGIGPKDIGLDKLYQRFAAGDLTEIILATNPTVEGEATAHYIAEMAKPFALKISRIAYGVPVGGELEYVDGGTLARAIRGRESY